MNVQPKYTCEMGDPLDMLAEEASEIVQARFKWLRFGADGAVAHGYTGQNPVDQMHQEIGDFLALLSHCVMTGALSQEALDAAVLRKRERVRKLFGVELK